MVRVAIVGIGNVASALLQGIEYYKEGKLNPIGLLSEIEEISFQEMEFVMGFDVHAKKVGLDLSEAIFVKPNCARELFKPAESGAKVVKGPVLDGLDSAIKDHIPIDESQRPADVKETLESHNIDVVAILLPTGSNKAAKHYATEAIKAGCAIVNGMPSLIANDSDLVELAREHNVPIIGDDVKSQVGATIVHRSLSNIFPLRNAVMDRTLQLDWGGDMDFCNLTSNGRYEKGKRQSKTESVIEHLPNKANVDVQISAVDYIPFLENQKECYMRVEGRIFGGMPVRIDIIQQVQDGYNSAGIVADMIRVAMIAKKRHVGGVLHSASSFFNKKPPQQLDDETAKLRLIEFLKGERER